MLGHKKPIGRWIVVMLWCFSSGMALAQTADEALLAAQLNFQRAKASIDEADKKTAIGHSSPYAGRTTIVGCAAYVAAG